MKTSFSYTNREKLMIYLDNAATTKVREEVKKEMKMLENNKENLTDLLDLYTRQLEYGKKDFKQRASDK